MKESKKMLPYSLKRETSGELLMDGQYVKHYFEGYCALFEKYPATSTTVWLCRKLDFADRSYKNNLCILYRNYPNEPSTLIGYYVFLCEVSSESEATKKMQEEIEGDLFFRSIIEEFNA